MAEEDAEQDRQMPRHGKMRWAIRAEVAQRPNVEGEIDQGYIRGLCGLCRGKGYVYVCMCVCVCVCVCGIPGLYETGASSHAGAVSGRSRAGSPTSPSWNTGSPGGCG